MDGLYKHLSKNGNTQFVDAVYDIFTKEEYDSDALEMDLLLYKENGVCNMINTIPIKKNFDAVYAYIYEQKCMIIYLLLLFYVSKSYLIHC